MAQQAPKRKPPVRKGSYEAQTSAYKSGSVNKNNPNNQNKGGSRAVPKRRHHRGGNYTLYYIMVIIIIAVALIILSNTVFFKCSGFEVLGNDKYSEEEIISQSGLNIGDNLLRVNTKAAEESILSSLTYIDEAEVNKSFPTKITITVKEAQKHYRVIDGGVTVVISQKGKILEQGGDGELPLVKGYEPESTDVGGWLKSKADGKTEIPAEVFAAADKAQLKNITEVDVTDKFNVKVIVENRVILELGTTELLQNKLFAAQKLLETQIGPEEYVTMLLQNPEKVPVQNNSLPQTPTTPVTSSVQSVPESETNPEPQPDPEPAPDPQPDPEPSPQPDPTLG